VLQQLGGNIRVRKYIINKRAGRVYPREVKCVTSARLFTARSKNARRNKKANRKEKQARTGTKQQSGGQKGKGERVIGIFAHD
jgi:hypothetical protein